jgi:predicted component of viral defense system (DUF524 family)
MSLPVHFFDDQGLKICSIILHQLDNNAGSLREIPPEEAEDFGEECIQLSEGCSYQFHVSEPDFHLKLIPGIVRKLVSIGEERDTGIISPGLYVGRLVLTIQKEDVDCSKAAVEVRSRKLSFRSEYRRMLDDVSAASLDLLISLGSPSETRVVIDPSINTTSAQQVFFFLHSLIGGEDFAAAIKRIVSYPHTALSSNDLEQPISRIGRAEAGMLRQLASKQPRVPVPTDHVFSTKLSSLPRNVIRREHVETVDTRENRFVKFVLTQMRDFLDDLTRLLDRGSTNDQLFGRSCVTPLVMKLDGFLHQPFFASIGLLLDLSIVSPVLQKRSGYREVLSSWIKFQSGATLSWGASSDVFGVGVKNAAVLYEYWVFFILLSVFDPWIEDRALIARSILRRGRGGLSLSLKYGELLEVEGLRIKHAGLTWRVQFFFNKTFSTGSSSEVTGRLRYLSTPTGEAWTRRMRPDYSFLIFPEGVEIEEAIRLGKFAQLHFDAKYSIKSLIEAFGSEDDTPIIGGIDANYNRTDLLKMHAYKDAIRRASGSYILYPGNDFNSGHQLWREYHEVLPGLGAFSVRPSDTDRASEMLRLFFLDVLDQLVGVVSLGFSSLFKDRLERPSVGHFNLPPRDRCETPLVVN